MNIYIRPLRESDALISYKWRNDPEIWVYTGSRPDRLITAEIETAWIRRVISDTTSRRFAICIEHSDEYIGNAQLNNIKHVSAEYHIFIGNKAYWGKGVATKATELVINYASNILKLESVYSEVNSKNIASIKAFEKNNFMALDKSTMIIKMIRILTNADPNNVSVIGGRSNKQDK
jgi:RimJ/RimL family protein N-acetyltransferase